MTDPSALPEQPLPSFAEMPISDDVKQSLAEMGYVNPTPVQHAIYDLAVRGTDLVVQARTGTGKTAAFGIPIVDQIVKRSMGAVQALVLAPTRELAVQVSRELTRLGAKREVKIAAVYGGAPMQRQIDAIRAGAHVVVGTPGRVLDHLRRGTLDAKNIRVLILDESDEMLSMGFERELTAIIDFLPAGRQTLLFSATLPPEIVRIARSRLSTPQFVTLSGDQVGALDVLHYVYFVREDKGDVLLRVLEVENPESAVVFCNTRDETERVAQLLQRAGFDAEVLNGDLPQNEREVVMDKSKQGKLRFLVATDVAARGIDISHLTHVINYDFPDTPETYVHRTGRTGRMGRTGTAINLVLPQDIGGLYILRLTYKIRPFEKHIPTAAELKTRAEVDLIQSMAETFGKAAPHPDDVALAKRVLTHDQVETIIAGLLRSHLGERPQALEKAAAARRARPPSPPPPDQPAEQPQPQEQDRPRRRDRADRPERSERRDDRPERSERRDDRPERSERREMDRPRREPRDDDARQRPRDMDRPRRERPAHEEVDLDLPSYEVTAMPAEPEEPASEPQAEVPEVDEPTRDTDPPPPPDPAKMGHAALAEWSPPAEDNDDVPILADPLPDAGVSDADAVPSEDQGEVYVNVGRRDGAHTQDFLRLLEESNTLERGDVARVRVRDRHTFVVVRKEKLDQAIEVLHGARIAGKIVMAEAARPKQPM